MLEKSIPVFSKPLAVKEAMELTGFSRSYIYKLVHWRKLPCHKPTNGKLFFKRDELEEFCYRGKQLTDYELMEAAESILNNKPRRKNIRQ
jgi:excisionase family DNA binding protein